MDPYATLGPSGCAKPARFVRGVTWWVCWLAGPPPPTVRGFGRRPAADGLARGTTDLRRERSEDQTPKSDQWLPTSWFSYPPRSHATQMRLGFDGSATMALTGEVGRSPDLSIQCALPSTERKTEPGMVE